MRAHYCWSPRGHVFVDGYWDRALEDRGLLFAPVSFSTPLWNTPGWAYRPSCAVDVDNLLGSLFVRPSYSHYYFGDYYGAGYDRLGFQPWFTHGSRVRDPLFGYYAWQNRGNPNWHNGLRGLYEARREGRVPRPARTLREQDTSCSASTAIGRAAPREFRNTTRCGR